MYSLFPAAVAILFLGYGLYVLARAGPNRVSLSFLLLCVTTFAWQFTWAVLFQVKDPAVADVLVRVGYFFILFLPTSLYHFLVEITGRRSELPRVWLSYGVAGLLALVLFPTDLFVAGWYEYFFGYYPRAGVLHPVHVLQTCVVVLRGLFITWKAQQVAAPRLRIRLRYCVTSLLIYLFAAVDYLCNYGLEFYPPGVFLLAISLGLLAVATVKHQLMDVSMALSQGFARLLTLLLFVLAWTGGYLALATLFPDPNFYVELALGVVFLVVVSEGYVPLWRFLLGLQGRLLRGERRNFQSAQAVKAVSRALGTHISLADMMRDLEEALMANSHLRRFHLFLRDDFNEGGDVLPKGEYLLWDLHRGGINYQERIAGNHPLTRRLAGTDPVAHHREVDVESAALLDRWQAQSAVGVKLDGKLMALLLVGVEEGITHYTYQDLDLIEFLPAQLALGLDRVQAYTRLSHGLNRAQKSASLMALMNEYQHELKAPISIMHMYSQADVAPELLRSEVRTQCDRVLDLLDKMLHVLQDNRVREERPVDVNAVVTSALRLFPVPGLQVKMELEPGLPRLVGDADDLLILFVNLIKNAREASDPDRENRIRIATTYLADLKAIRIIVEDTGSGMSEALLRRLWLPATSEKDGGTGLGLKVMQRIVAEHGGDIRVTSTPGQGSCFEIRLPLMAGDGSGVFHG